MPKSLSLVRWCIFAVLTDRHWRSQGLAVNMVRNDPLEPSDDQRNLLVLFQLRWLFWKGYICPQVIKYTDQWGLRGQKCLFSSTGFPGNNLYAYFLIWDIIYAIWNMPFGIWNRYWNIESTRSVFLELVSKKCRGPWVTVPNNWFCSNQLISIISRTSLNSLILIKWPYC